MNKKFENLREMKEYRLAMQVKDQQNLYKLLKECLVVMADDKRRYDDRNRASHEEAKDIVAFLEENGHYIPYI